jgi:IS30 family transposase
MTASNKSAPWSPAALRTLALFAERGLSSRSIASQLGRTPDTVRWQASRQGIKIQRRSPNVKLRLADVPEVRARCNAVRDARARLRDYLIAKGYVTKQSRLRIVKQLRDGWRPAA